MNGAKTVISGHVAQLAGLFSAVFYFRIEFEWTRHCVVTRSLPRLANLVYFLKMRPYAALHLEI